MARRGPRPVVRLVALLGTMAVLLALVAGRLFYLQAVEADLFDALGAKQRVRALDLPARRGAILDRRMRPLAVSVEARAIYANPRFVPDAAAAAAQIAPVLGLPAAGLEERLRRDKGFVYLARKVAPNVARSVLDLGIPGVDALEETRRVYPAGPLAGQLIGFSGTDDVGLAGLESERDDLLRGTPGREVIEQDPQGRPIPQGRHSLRPPEAGRGLVLTIDRDVQFAAERALERAVAASGARGGSAVVLAPRGGDILAMANYPLFDPNEFRTAAPGSWRNRAATDVYEPGSVMKAVTAAAALENRRVRLDDSFRVPDRIRLGGRTFNDYRNHAPTWMSLGEILAESSNVGAIKVGDRVGASRLYRMLRRFGFGRATGSGLAGESTGILAPAERWYPTSMGTIPIGQGIAVTPLQLAAAYGVFANDGVWVRPRIVRAVLERDGTVADRPRSERRRAISARTAAEIRALLAGVVEEGTGHRARISGYVIAGKTGTARQPKKDARGYSREIFTTFAGVVPVERPRLVVVVTLDNPAIRFAAQTAAPAFREIVQDSIVRLGIAPAVPAEDRGVPLAARRAG